MTDERQRGARETDRTDDGPVALGEVFQLQEQLAARGSRVRQDAERALDRAAALRADGDPRAGIAVSACRERLGAYQEAVDRSVRQACGAADSTAVGSAPPTARSTRHKIARLLAAAMMTGVLGLVGWGGLPSWSTVLATSPGYSAAPPERPVATEPPAEPPEVSTGADRAPRPEGRTGVVGRSDDRPVPADRPASRDLPHDDVRGVDVRGVLATTLPGVGELSPSVATMADGLRAVGEAAASLATVGEPLSSDGPSDGPTDGPSDGNANDDAAEAARSLLPDPVDTVKATVDAASDAAAGVNELGDGELLDVRSSDKAEDGDGLEGVIDEGEQLWDDPDSPKRDDRADAPSADGMSEGAGLDR